MSDEWVRGGAQSTRADALILDRTDAGREEYALIRSHSERLHSQPQSEVVHAASILAGVQAFVHIESGL